jgi:hypothetical protein
MSIATFKGRCHHCGRDDSWDAASNSHGWHFTPSDSTLIAADIAAQPLAKKYANILEIQLRESQGGDYMLGLYNGMRLICSLEDGTEYQPIAAQQAPCVSEGKCHHPRNDSTPVDRFDCSVCGQSYGTKKSAQLCCNSQPAAGGGALCGAPAVGGPCVLPDGHNIGRLDIPSNHTAAGGGDTPETDLLDRNYGLSDCNYAFMRAHSRKLERQRDEAIAELSSWKMLSEGHQRIARKHRERAEAAEREAEAIRIDHCREETIICPECGKYVIFPDN